MSQWDTVQYSHGQLYEWGMNLLDCQKKFPKKNQCTLPHPASDEATEDGEATSEREETCRLAEKFLLIKALQRIVDWHNALEVCQTGIDNLKKKLGNEDNMDMILYLGLDNAHCSHD